VIIFLIFRVNVMIGVSRYIIIIFTVSDVIVKIVFICLRGMVVSVILNVLDSWITSIIHWMVSKTKHTFCWNVLAFCARCLRYVDRHNGRNELCYCSNVAYDHSPGNSYIVGICSFILGASTLIFV